MNNLDLRSIVNWVESIKKLPMLQNLHLSHCQLQTPSLGISNSSLGILGHLKTLDLSNNNLTGNFFHILKVLNVGSNSLNLTLLDLSFNSLEGAISESFLSCLPNLQVLGLSHNFLTLSLSSDWIPPFHLKVMKLSSCNLGPNFPTWLHTHMDFEYLDISCNRIRDFIPDWFWDLSDQLRYLNLSYNSLSGTLPNTTLHLENNCQIDLSYNEFAGEGVKAEYHNTLALLKLIDLSANQLTGQIPEGLTSLYELVSLNLSRNHFSGNIPEKIGQLTQLNSLDLSNNRLTGRIPKSMANICFLGYLDLSNNDLCGAIPKGTQLQSFDASKYAGNPQLCGLPTLNVCPGDEILPRSPGTQGNNKHDHWKENMGFYISLIFGFAIGFWGVCWTLLLPSS
nr:leucine-rich repeat receptor-like protein kinase PXC2 [Ipomoea trifida]